MGEDATPDSSKGLTVKRISMSVDHRFLSRLEPDSIRVLLRWYDVYCREVKDRASQLAQESSIPLEHARPVGLTFCIDADKMESAVECWIIPNCTSVEALTDESLLSFIDSEYQESQTTVMERYMTVKSARVRMKLLFMEYKSLLWTNALKWVIEKSPEDCGPSHTLGNQASPIADSPRTGHKLLAQLPRGRLRGLHETRDRSLRRF